MAPPKISDLRHRVALCSQADVVVSGDTMVLARKEIAQTWAGIKHQPNRSSFISPAGYAVQEAADRATHRITVRTGLEIDYTTTAWVYEERLKSPARWYKVLGFVEQEAFTILECHLVEKSKNVSPPQGDLAPAPQGVVL